MRRALSILAITTGACTVAFPFVDGDDDLFLDVDDGSGWVHCRIHDAAGDTLRHGVLVQDRAGE